MSAVPVYVLCAQCHMSAVPVYAGIKKRSVKRFGVSVLLAYLICFAVYSFVGVFGVLLFSNECIASDILRNFCPSDIPVDVARLSLVLCLITTYPILHYCGR